MKKWYGVETRIFDYDKITQKLIGPKEAEKKPKMSYKDTALCDIYMDWFGSESRAKKFIEGKINK